MSNIATVNDHYYVANVAELERVGIDITIKLNTVRQWRTTGEIPPEEWGNVPTGDKQRLISHISYSISCLGIDFIAKPTYAEYAKVKYVNSIYPERIFSNLVVLGNKEDLLRLTHHLDKSPSRVIHVKELALNYPDIYKS